jgi:hypothetical protein
VTRVHLVSDLFAGTQLKSPGGLCICAKEYDCFAGG